MTELDFASPISRLPVFSTVAGLTALTGALLTFAAAGLAPPAAAQTLTVSMEASGELEMPPRPTPPARSGTARLGGDIARLESDDQDDRSSLPSPAPVVIVRPPEGSDDLPVAARSPAESAARVLVRVQPPAAAFHDGTGRPVTPPAAPPPAGHRPEPPTREPSSLQGAAWAGMFVDAMNLEGAHLRFDDPEVRALAGLQLDPEWAGRESLSSVAVTGVGFGFGLRAERIIRGPELRFYVGAGGVDSAWHPAGGETDLSLAITGAVVAKTEASIGLQVEIGPLTPYVMGRAAIGGAWLNVAVEDARLGRIGSETVDHLVLELGVEAGVEATLTDEGLILGAAFRGSFLGTESYGGAVTLGWHS